MKRILLAILALACTGISQAQVVINEITPDPGNYDGQGAEWTELYNKSTTTIDMSCWVLTDGEEIVVFPSGTTIPGNGYLVIYNGNFFNPSNNSGNWYNAFNTYVTNNATTVKAINLATCGCTNQLGCFGVTWDNPSGDNGTDRVALFNQNAVIQSAVYYGIGDNYAAASAAIPESIYATGPNTANKNITGAAAGCNLPAANNYTIPALPAAAGTSNATWEYIGGSINGCTTSKARTVNGGMVWVDDNWPTPGASNANPDFKVTYSLNGGTAVDITATDNIVLNVCTGATLAFNGEVYDFNQIYHTNAGDAAVLEGGSSRGGSHVVATGGLTFDNGWAEAAVTATGTTALSYPTTAAITAATTFKLFIKENTSGAGTNPNSSDCAAAGSTINGSGAASECYILKTITVNITQPLVSASFTCSNGLVRVTALPTTATGLTYNLINSANATLNQSNSTGQFQITSGTAANYSIQVIQNPACGGPITATGTICVFAPPCPTFTAYDACATAAGPICPSSNISLSLTGTNLPNGGKVEWVNDTNNNGDVYDEATTAVVATQDINTTTPSSIPSGAVRLNEVLFNATTESSTTNGEAWEIAGTPGTNIGCMYFTDGDFVVQIPSGTLMPASGFYVIGGSAYVAQAGQPAANLTLAATTGLGNLTNSSGSATGNGEFLALFNAANAFVNGVFWGPTTSGTPSASTTSNNPQNCPNPTIIVSGGSGCSLPSAATIAANVIANANAFALVGNFNTAEEQSIELSTDLATTWQLSAAPGSVVNTLGSTNTGTPTPVTTLMPTCVTYTIPSTACNTTLRLKPRIAPNQVGCSPGSATPTLATRAYTVSCPTATIAGQKAICDGASTSFDVALTGFGTSTTATVSYSINGGSAITTTTLPITNGIVTVNNINTAGVYTLTAVSFGGGGAVCTSSHTGDVTVIVATNPAAPSTSSVTACTNATTPIYASGGGPSYNWYSNAALSTQVATGSPYYYNGGSTTLYVQSIDPDNGCKSAAATVTVTTTTPPVLTIPATIDCSSGSFSQAATGGSGTLTFTLAGKSGTGGDAVGTSNTSGNFNLSGCVGATILVEDANGCYDINTYNFTNAPYNCASALALQYVQFTAQAINQSVQLTWQVYDDSKVINYSIERSSNGVQYNPIGNTTSIRTNATATYTYTDYNPVQGKNYYRIKATNNTGAALLTNVKLVQYSNAFMVTMLPNPAVHTFEILMNNNAKNEITIVNATGKVYYQQTNNLSKYIINCAQWSKGIYVVKVTNISTGAKVYNKIVIQ